MYSEIDKSLKEYYFYEMMYVLALIKITKPVIILLLPFNH